MKNECFNVAITITTGAVVVFFAVLARVARTAYLNGFASGFDAARERFKRIFKAFENDIDADGTP
jgi:hypothetical protein